MGLIFFLGINWLLIMLVASLFKKPGELRVVAKSWVNHPFMSTFLFVWNSSILVAGWGVLTGGYFSWPVFTPWGHLQSWQLGGIVAFVGLVIFFGVSAYENHAHRKRYEQ